MTLHPAGDGRWVKETALAPGTYEYCLVAYGEWMPDPLAKDYVPNPSGGWNSVLQVPSPDAIRLAAARPDVIEKQRSNEGAKSIESPAGGCQRDRSIK